MSRANQQAGRSSAARYYEERLRALAAEQQAVYEEALTALDEARRLKAGQGAAAAIASATLMAEDLADQYIWLSIAESAIRHELE